MDKKLFSSPTVSTRRPATTTVNKAGGIAYERTAESALAQYVATGCLSSTFYAGAQEQLDTILELLGKVRPEFAAKCAVYGRQRGYMKDTPALIMAWLSANGELDLLTKAWPFVIDNAKEVRNYAQIIRSGKLGRKSFGSRPKKLIQSWFNSLNDHQLFNASVGDSPSLADVINMVHPRPTTVSRRALYAYLIGKDFEFEALPPLVQSYELFKKGQTKEVPRCNFLLLTALPLDTAAWTRIASQCNWTALRMNLNTFARHGVFKDSEATKLVAKRLADPAEIGKARIFPYQLFTAFQYLSSDVPMPVKLALQDAMEVAIQNIPSWDTTVAYCQDVSGSMRSCPVTGFRKGSTSKSTCNDVGALIGAAIARRNPGVQLLPFDDSVHPTSLNPRDSVMTLAGQLARIGGGGTAISAPLTYMNHRGDKADLVVYVSDNESWRETADPKSYGAQGFGGYGYGYGRTQAVGNSTVTMQQWDIFKRRNPRAKMVCIDLSPNTTVQAVEGKDVFHIGGFSDAVFDMIAQFLKGDMGQDHWVGEIDKIDLDRGMVQVERAASEAAASE